MLLYKYLPLNDKTENGFDALKVLTEQTLWYSSPLDFNDPFDCRPIVEMPSMKEMKRENGDLFKQVAQNLGVKGAKKFENDRKAYQGLKISVENGDFLHRLISRVGVTCFSETPLEILMWSHYANNHKGFVVEFEINHAEFLEGLDERTDKEHFDSIIHNLLAQPVRYEEYRPKLKPYIKGNKTGELTQWLLQTKSKHWEYEKEYRIVTSLEHGAGAYKFNPRLLKRIIVGMCTPSDYLKRINESVLAFEESNNVDVPVLFAKSSNNDYSIVIPGLE